MAKKKKTQSKKPKFGILVFGLIFAAIGLYLVVRSFAATVALNATSNKTSVEKGQTFIVTVGADSGTEPISIGHARLTYDPAKVQYVSTDYTNTSFTDNSPESANGNGYIQLSRFTTQRPAGNLTIGRVTFKALASSGNLAIGLDRENSHVFSATDASDILSAVNGVNVEVKQPTDGGTGGGVVITPTTPTPPKVPKGDNVQANPGTTTSTGSPVKKTDYYLNGGYVGTSTGADDPVNIDTDNLTEGTYEITAKTEGEDGKVEETTKSFTVTAGGFLSRFQLPLIVSGLAIAAIGIGFMLKFVFMHAVPFYKTI